MKDLDHRKLLKDTKESVKQGKYEEALLTYQKFFKDSAEIDSLGGVRLSCCLMDWKELADKFPPALQSFEELRDNTYSKVEEYLQVNTTTKDAFNIIHELVAINRTLNKNSESIELFKRFDEQNSEVAESFSIYIKELLASAGEYELCYKYLDIPEKFLLKWKDCFDLFIELEESTPSHISETILERHIEELNYMLFILIKIDHQDIATEIRNELTAYIREKGREQYIELIKPWCK